MEQINEYAFKSIKIQRKINRKLALLVVLLATNLYFTYIKPKNAKGA